MTWTWVQHPALHMLVGFIVMGSWAAFTNWTYAMPAPLIAGLVQGTMSAAFTLGLRWLTEVVAARMHRKRTMSLVPVVICAVTVAILTVIHTLAGTPEILRILLVAVAITTFYSGMQTYGIWKNRK